MYAAVPEPYAAEVVTPRVVRGIGIDCGMGTERPLRLPEE